MRITYIEDPDSLRFALGVMDFDPAQAQPHFPGYPPYIFIVKIFYWITGNISLAFTLVGSLASCVTVYATHQIFTLLRHRRLNPIVTAVIAFTPLLWIMSNRFMADVTGLAFLVSAVWIGLRFYKSGKAIDIIIFAGLVGLLVGIRLSYLPFLFPLSVLFIPRIKTWHWQLLGYGFGVFIWLVPTVFIMGWDNFWSEGFSHGSGHFNEWGGTISNSSNITRRLLFIPEDILTHGFGFWWKDRHWLTIIVSITLLIGFYYGIKKQKRSELLAPIGFGLLLYLIWIFLYQNIEFKPRHILPFLPFIGFYMFLGLSELGRKNWLFLLIITPVIIISSYLSHQHKNPSAIAGAIAYIKSSEQSAIATHELVGYMIERQCEDKTIVPEDYQGPLLSIQNKLEGRTLKDSTIYTHNPYVNKMWPIIVLYEYE